MKGIGRAEEGNLRRAERGREVHRGGIDRDQEPRPLEKRREREQVDLSRKIEDRMLQLRL